MKASTIPEFLILDSEEESRHLGYLIQNFHMEEGDIFRSILECISYERNADAELEVWRREFAKMMTSAGFAEVAENSAHLVMNLGRKIFDQLRLYKAYHNGYLIYCYHQDMNGDLVLRALEHGDLTLH